ncbi:MAG: hypothetical protein RL491_105 [Bacteroidota bacterium]
MAINKNHPFEDIDGIKCAVVETGVSEERKNFLKELLEFNRYQVVVSAEAAKAPAAAAPADGEANEAVVSTPVPPTTYKLGVTDVTFNTTNAIYGRLLRTRNGRVVTMAYWQQQDTVSRDDVPYFDVSKS